MHLKFSAVVVVDTVGCHAVRHYSSLGDTLREHVPRSYRYHQLDEIIYFGCKGLYNLMDSGFIEGRERITDDYKKPSRRQEL